MYLYVKQFIQEDNNKETRTRPSGLDLDVKSGLYTLQLKRFGYLSVQLFSTL